MIEHDIWFSILKLNNSIKLKLLKKMCSTENIFNYGMDQSFMISGDTNEIKIKNLMKNSYDKNLIEKLKILIYKNDIKMISFNQSTYPENIKYYEDAPAIIYYRGDIKRLNIRKSAAIVGSRNCSSYGKSIAASIAKELSENNVSVISGLAKGIDAAAHESCIKSQGFTCGVLGCGIDIIYPKENYKLFQEMFQSGCVISEFAPGTRPYFYNFPLRNRIISGLSDLVIIVEAGSKSGSLITANLALDQGKDVMAVPGSLFSENSRGTNRLLHDGAHVFTEMKDVYELLEMNYGIVKINKPLESDDFHSKILNALTDKPAHIDEIINITHIDIKQLYELLFELQLDNQILSLSGNYYIKVANN